MSVALGLITCDRPEYLYQVVHGIGIEGANLDLDYFFIVNDGLNLLDADDIGDDCHIDGAWPYGLSTPHSHSGVAVAKNVAVKAFLQTDASWLFLAEDDIVPQSPEAITGYIDACERSGFGHLAFHGHGPMNKAPMKEQFDAYARTVVTIWPQFVGAWCVYSRRCFEEVGMFDEGFHNGLEHVEMSMRLALAGLTPMPPGAADATGSEQWLREIEGSADNSTIPKENFERNKAYWRTAHSDTYALLWPNG